MQPPPPAAHLAHDVVVEREQLVRLCLNLLRQLTRGAEHQHAHALRADGAGLEKLQGRTAHRGTDK